MAFPFDLVVRDLILPPGDSKHIQERVEKLHQFYDKIERVRVTVNGPGRHHRQGHCKVTVEVAVPGEDVRVNRQSGEDIKEAVREAFTAAERRLEDRVRMSRGFVKRHETL